MPQPMRIQLPPPPPRKAQITPMTEEEQSQVEVARYQEWERREAERKAQEFRDRLLRCGIPERLVGATLDNFCTTSLDQETVLKKAWTLAGGFRSGQRIPAQCALLYGRPGTGKTHLAVGIMSAVASHYGVRYTTVSSLAREVRSTYHRSAEKTELDVLESHIRPSLLTIDEIGVGLGTDHERAMLHDVIAGRYDAMKPTILISNLDLAAVREALGERIVDRIREDNGWAFGFNWDSYRAGSR